MSKQLIWIALLVFLLVSLGMAQTAGPDRPVLVQERRLQIGAQVGGSLGDNEQPRELNDFGENVRESYRVFIDFGLMDRVRAQIGSAYAGMAGHHYSTGLTSADGRVLYFPSTSPGFSPYLYAGIGAMRYEIFQTGPGRLSPGVAADGWVAHAPLGAGFVTQFSQRVGLDLTLGWHYIMSDNANGRLGSANDSYWSALLGLRFALGKTAYERQQEELQKKLAEEERLRKEAALRAAEERRKKDLEAVKAAEDLKRKQEQAQKEMEARKAAEAQKPPEPPPVKVQEPPAPPKPVLKFEPVYFLTGGSKISPMESVKLDAAAKALMEYPSMKVAVSGHTDNVGSRAVNERISLARAKAVKSYLMKKGIAEERITIESFVYDKPAADNDTQEGRQLNRRAELKAVE